MSLTPVHHLDAGALPAEPALVWPWAHNWGEKVGEGLEWKTAIHRSQNSIEQRRALRSQPRLQVSLSHTLDSTQAPTAVSLLRAWKGKPWAVPVWWAGSKLTLSAGSTLTLSRPTETLWHAGQWGVIWASEAQLELVQVASVSTSSVTLTAAPDGSWPAGTLVMPLVMCDLPDDQSASAPVGDVVRLDVTFDARPSSTSVLDEPSDGSFWVSTFPAGTSPADPRAHLMDLVHNFAEAAQITATSAVEVLDSDVGLIARRPSQKHPTLSWSLNLLLDGDVALAQMRKFLAAHRGSAIGFYAAAPVADTEATDIVAGVATVPSLRFYTDPEELFVGMSYLGEVDQPRVTQQVLDITGSAVTLASPAGLEASLLLHLDGNLTDATGNVTFTGSTGYTTVDGTWGQASITGTEGGPGMVGASSVNLSIGGRPWTLEGRSKFSGTDGGGIVLCKNYYPSEPSDFSVDFNFKVTPTSMSVTWKNLLYPLEASFTAITGEWFSWAMSDDGTTLRFFINGTMIHSRASCQLSSPAPVAASSAQVAFLNGLQGFSGDNPNWSTGRYSGQIDEVRMHAGTALYTDTSYAVATAPFADNGGETITRSISAARMICPCRLATDTIEIAHVAPGVAQMSLPLVTTVVPEALSGGGGGSGGSSGWQVPGYAGYEIQQGDITVEVPYELSEGSTGVMTCAIGFREDGRITFLTTGADTYIVVPTTGWVTPLPAPSGLADLFQAYVEGATWRDIPETPIYFAKDFTVTGSPVTQTFNFQIRDKATQTVRTSANLIITLREGL